MAEIRLTAAQQAAVDDRDGVLLVSAAAGSGKTKVLVERLMARVCDPVNPRNIHDFLIITYTKAAASELRGKISAELAARLAAAPGNRHLQRQLSDVYLAQISTVHAFCGDLLKTYGHVIDLPSDFRVAEESEASLLRSRCLDQVLEELYAQAAQSAETRSMADILGYGRTDAGAAAAVEALYQAARCHPDPKKWLRECREALETVRYQSCLDTPWGRELLAQFREFLETQHRSISGAMERMNGIQAVEDAYLPYFRELQSLLELLRTVDSWDRLMDAIPVSFPRLKAVRNFEDKAFLARLKAARTRCMDGLKDWRGVFEGGDAAALEDLRTSAAALRGALTAAELLDRRFTAEKRRRRMLDFGDLEHETIRLLTDASTGRPTAVAREIAQRYEEVLVDEYQDSNAVQETIFAAISPAGRRFLVGDVKQSIYRFRLADPTIFLEKYRTYRPAAEAAAGEPRKLLLSENFRSRPEILAAVNDVFRTVMSQEVGDLDYGDEEALKPGLSFPPASEPVVELHCLEPGSHEDDGGTEGKNETEARFVAARISQLLATGTVTDLNGSRPIRPEDIVILLRSVGSAAPAYLAALREAGIPCVSDRGESILDSREVEVLTAILQTVDNPCRDVPLVSALTSPVFGFTASDLAFCRSKSRRGCFYDAVTAAAEEHPKAAAFLRWLEPAREQARWLPLHSLLRKIYDETGIEAVFGAMDGGRDRCENLRTFFSYAASFAADGKATLMDFLDHLETMRRQGTALPPSARTGGGAVRIMSIHKSKGLEFPVVILADLSRRFNTEDLQRTVITHPQLFAASNVVDSDLGVRYPTFAKRAISARIRRENLSEELRVLYVAMTRAQHRLIMTYCSKFLGTELENLAAEASCPVSPDAAARAKSPGSWILTAALCRREAGALFAYLELPNTGTDHPYPWDIQVHTADRRQTAVIGSTEEEERTTLELPDARTLRRRLEARYPYLHASEVPSKLTATQLKGRELDQEASEAADTLLPQTRRRQRLRPAFATEERGLTATEKGTANHLFLQFADYTACGSPEGISEEVQRLVRQEFLTEEQARAVEQQQILALFSSPLGRRLVQSDRVVREQKFSLLVDAGHFDREVAGERIMLQGVVDCLLQDDDGLTIIDFKTDAVQPGGEQKRADWYAGQLRAYALALGRIYQAPVKACILFFLKTAAAVEISEQNMEGATSLLREEGSNGNA